MNPRAPTLGDIRMTAFEIRRYVSAPRRRKPARPACAIVPTVRLVFSIVLLALSLAGTISAAGCGRVGFGPGDSGLPTDSAADSALPADSGPSDSGPTDASDSAVFVDAGDAGSVAPHCATLPDQDGDGYDDVACAGGTDCDDTRPRVFPDAVEDPSLGSTCFDRLDNDCDRQTDGAEVGCAQVIYRSVGVEVVTGKAVGVTVAVAGGRAVFSDDLGASAGVGDVVEYGSLGARRVAFIHGRFSATDYLLREADGSTPADVPAGTNADVYRAYTSLQAFQNLDENDDLDDAVEDFDTSRDLAGRGISLHVALYADAVDRGNVTVTGWVTSPSSFLRLFTPVDPQEVGVSQRHAGIYGTGYRLEAAAATHTLAIDTAHVRLEGLSVKSSLGASGPAAISIVATAPDIAVYVEHCIAHGNGTISTNGIIHLEAEGAVAAGTFFNSNNIAYNAPTGSSECIWHRNTLGADATFYVYNNTVFDCMRGIEAREMTGRLIARNNISFTNGGQAFYDYDGVDDGFSPMSRDNVSGDGTAAVIGPAILIDADAAELFVSVTPGAEDFHLRPGAAAVLDLAGDLANDVFYPIGLDVDGQPRPRGAGWDPGADEL